LQEEELDSTEKMAKKERSGGNYGAGTKELQVRGATGISLCHPQVQQGGTVWLLEDKAFWQSCQVFCWWAAAPGIVECASPLFIQPYPCNIVCLNVDFVVCQARNFVSRKEQERKRRELFDDALAKFNKNDIEVRAGADVEMVVGSDGESQ
jgi:hypothetical protein